MTRLIAIFMAAIATCPALAEDELFSAYTASELHSMATNAMNAANKPWANFTEQDVIDVAEIRGYVAGLLEQGKPGSRLSLCAKRIGPNKTAKRFAIAMASQNLPASPPSGALLAMVALANACDDSLWE